MRSAVPPHAARIEARARRARGLAAVVLALAAGCSAPPAFPPNREGREPATIGKAQAEAIAEALVHFFGTPDEPRLPDGAGFDRALIQAAAGPLTNDREGNQGGLYRRHCASCHGLAGDGAGPAAAALSPYPRDFRQGVFKYTSTAGGAKPSRDDLRRTLLRGLPGTAMPSQARLPDDQREALVEYVRYLSVRGQTELYLLQLVVDEDAYLPLEMAEVLDEGVLPAARSWAAAERSVVVPPRRPRLNPTERQQALALGQQWYASKDAQCVKCHGPTGRGDGEEQELYDDWSKPKKGVTPAETERLAARFALPIQRLKARNFAEGMFRGGNAPEDLYLRIHVGIKGTPMPPAGPAPGSSGTLSPEQIWQVVAYVRSLAGWIDD